MHMQMVQFLNLIKCWQYLWMKIHQKGQFAHCVKNRLLFQYNFQSVKLGEFALSCVEGGEVGGFRFEG